MKPQIIAVLSSLAIVGMLFAFASCGNFEDEIKAARSDAYEAGYHQGMEDSGNFYSEEDLEDAYWEGFENGASEMLDLTGGSDSDIEYIAGNNDDGTPLWNEPIYPVVRLDFSGYDTDSIELFREDFASQLNDYEKEYELKLTPCKGKISKTFKAFHQKFAKKFPKGYVILVDEYDYPLNAFINDKENFELFRKELRSFYAKIKESTICAAIRFMLVTGITRFKDVSIFSAGSNIIDISYDANIATIVGYTREEIEKYFKEYIDIAIEKQHNCSVSSIDSNTYQLYKNSLLDELALNYDNICYDEFGEQSVYSTWSVNNFFQDVANKSQVEFNDYWFANGGLPTILVNYLQKHLIVVQ